MAEFTKLEARYREQAATESVRCDRCDNFKKPNRCKLVEGDINPGGSCRLFEPKQRRKRQGGMSTDDYQARVKSLIDSATDFVRDEISETRKKTLRYLNGHVDIATPKEGRSKIVVTETRDTLCQMMPQLIRIFLGAERVVEFIPNGSEDDALAKQQTDYIDHLLMTQCGGWSLIHDFIYDGLAAMLAGLHAYVGEKTEVWESAYTKLSDAEYRTFEEDPDAEIIEAERTLEVEQLSLQLENGAMVLEEVEHATWDCRVRFKETKKRIMIETIPPEEIVIDRQATSHEDALVVGRLCERTPAALIALGLPKDKIEEASSANPLGTQQEKEERLEYPLEISETEDEQTVQVFDGYVRIDRDGDGIAEWRHLIALGEHYEIVEDEMVRGPQIVLCAPFRVAHAMFGDSVGTLTEDLQDLNTSLTRAMVDNLNFSTFPRVVTGPGVNMDDVMHWSPSSPIRSRQGANQVQPIMIPFAGQSVLPVLEHNEQRKEGRTGVSRAAMGLDPDALQSSSDFGVRETFTMGQSRIEMVARTIAETGIKPLFKLLLRLVAENEDAAQVVRLRGEWTNVDPRQFDVNMDVQINVGLGHGTRDEKAQALTWTMQQQKEVIAAAGPTNKLASAKHFYNAVTDFLKLFGFKATKRYFEDPGDMQEQEQQGPPPEVQAEMAKQQAELQLQQQKQQFEQQMKEREFAFEMEMKRREQQAEMQLERWKAAAELQLKTQVAEAENRLKNRELEMEGVIEAIKTQQGMPGGNANIPRQR